MIRLYQKYNKGGWGGEPCKASYMNTPCTLSKVKLHRPYETTADPVIAKGPEVMPDTVTQQQKTLTNAKTTSSTENTSSSSLTKLNYI